MEWSSKKEALQNKLPIEWEALSPSALIFDLVFYIAGIAVFYHSWLCLPAGLTVILLKGRFTKAYLKSGELRFLEFFIDFLNHLNSQLSVGMTFEKALLSLEGTRDYEKLTPLINTVQMGATSDRLYKALMDTFPIDDCVHYCDLLKTGRQLGVNPAFITGKTLEIIAYKQQIVSEIHRILYQKKMEQMILVFAPVAIILFIANISPDYLTILYVTPLGRMIMSIALGLIVLMKAIAAHIVKIEI
jgi:Flp pilus assembly protein TadB